MSDLHDEPETFVKDAFACPRCHNDELEAVTDGSQTNFLCHRCWTCWHVELGYIAPVPVSTCPGCRYKAECQRRRRLPSTGAGGISGWSS